MSEMREWMDLAAILFLWAVGVLVTFTLAMFPIWGTIVLVWLLFFR